MGGNLGVRRLGAAFVRAASSRRTPKASSRRPFGSAAPWRRFRQSGVEPPHSKSVEPPPIWECGTWVPLSYQSGVEPPHSKSVEPPPIWECGTWVPLSSERRRAAALQKRRAAAHLGVRRLGAAFVRAASSRRTPKASSRRPFGSAAPGCRFHTRAASSRRTPKASSRRPFGSAAPGCRFRQSGVEPPHSKSVEPPPIWECGALAPLSSERRRAAALQKRRAAAHLGVRHLGAAFIPERRRAAALQKEAPMMACSSAYLRYFSEQGHASPRRMKRPRTGAVGVARFRYDGGWEGAPPFAPRISCAA
ncbi:hypothetical protein HRbin22_02118 [Candidatus Thermoflexus japonica]|uniref:Uncharacterized protein n=1 Tax=Candidatus Thermoflexus japonica TaxID=2035417 RepID=A0A2H5Y8T0_9CHLR|nr:hypothetical protein HRbin22_02118 [Candidatus Thermoflexus japonica]